MAQQLGTPALGLELAGRGYFLDPQRRGIAPGSGDLDPSQLEVDDDNVVRRPEPMTTTSAYCPYPGERPPHMPRRPCP